ncbi:MAG: DNA/RNA helicase domain-containing protein, partial [Nitriliruptoraceae bacterium]
GIDQVGCIYTAQGFEVDYVGVIFGDDLVYRPREGWVGRKAFSHDRGLKHGTSDEEFTRLVKNTYRVLLSRGLKGCYLYFTDERTRDFVESRIDHLAVQLAAERSSGYTEVAP